MIQGSTLEASIADCGDVLDSCGLSELMTNYVILSRVKTAASLLLLRAFGHDLFQMGAPPGPWCLLKMLRQTFGNCNALDTECSTHTPAEGLQNTAAGQDPARRVHAPASQCPAAAREDMQIDTTGKADTPEPSLYGLDEAAQEYEMMMDAYTTWRAQRKAQGPQ